jgi:hypothetical protein
MLTASSNGLKETCTAQTAVDAFRSLFLCDAHDVYACGKLPEKGGKLVSHQVS